MRTALIVEDEPEANKLLAMLVRLKGYETVSAFNGRDALDAIRSSPPDVVFLDLMLPDIDGFQVCRAVKADPATSLVPIVMVTARLASENRRQGFRAGADEYIPKPYTPDQIFRALSEADGWLHAVREEPSAGPMPLEDDEDEFDRFRARVRSLLVARSPFGAPEVAGLDTAIGALRGELRNLGRGDDLSVAARVLPDRFALRLEGGGSGPALRDLRGLEGFRKFVLRPEAFDQAEVDEDAGALVLVRYFRNPSR